ncbi:MAG: tRNA (adenosine(37)-N6)-threonylcarbamoyltransferase complex ATPase subunit type 1 TsaE [Clostridia bacterium]|nr:tRNA (adenosine(37)-N6)-threonylcarbamoyltransferase complex ATPase subunit type 1 TsaE [Clostridia bacterium]
MRFPYTAYTSEVEGTEKIGKQLAAELEKDTSLPPFVALYGDLGVGKTAFVRGFVSEIAPAATVRSPTFALVNEYKAKPRALFHFDMYRIDSEDDLDSIGFYDYLDRSGICLVEWSEKIPFALPDRYLRVRVEKNDASNPNCRKITIESVEESL